MVAKKAPAVGKDVLFPFQTAMRLAVPSQGEPDNLPYQIEPERWLPALKLDGQIIRWRFKHALHRIGRIVERHIEALRVHSRPGHLAVLAAMVAA